MSMSTLTFTGKRTKGGSARHKPYKGQCYCLPRHPAWVSCEDWKVTLLRVLKADGISAHNNEALRSNG